MSTADTVTTANSILNKGRKPPKNGSFSIQDAAAALDKSQQGSVGSINPTVNFATEFPDTSPPDTSIPITNLVDVFERTLTE